ncbi:MAG: sigma-70 family RNA polymerase sigma factor [Phycisphaerales bacterium]|jgi:RNA polymerase sigma factor (sigma-70 family)|nr:sigma-70 family RNA polymerase sigma factor [Phycisphaerales bacterium]
MIGNTSPFDRIRERQRASDRWSQDQFETLFEMDYRTGLTLNDEDILKRLLDQPMDYIDSQEFYDKGAEQAILDDAPDIERPDVSWYRPLMDDLSAANKKRNTGGSVVLTAAEERVIFLQYNYARHRVAQLQHEIGPSRPSEDQVKSLLHWYCRARSFREQIAETNLALVLAMAKRTRMSEVDFADLVSEGNMALLRSVDKFDCGRGFKFSTYACRAILKAFSRQGMKLSKYRQRFPTDFDPALEKSNHLEITRGVREKELAEEVKDIVGSNAASLSSVEQTVVEHRFGLDSKELQKPLTLEQVGQIIGVTKERVRQIQNKALEKIKSILHERTEGPLIAEDESMSLPGNN